MASPAVESAAENAWLKLIGRGAMIACAPLLGWLATMLWHDHEAIGKATQQVESAQSDIKDIKAWEVDTNTTVSSVENRVSAVEINQKNGADRGQQFQSDTKAALSKLQDQNLTILQQLAALTATLRENRSP